MCVHKKKHTIAKVWNTIDAGFFSYTDFFSSLVVYKLQKEKLDSLQMLGSYNNNAWLAYVWQKKGICYDKAVDLTS